MYPEIQSYPFSCKEGYGQNKLTRSKILLMVISKISSMIQRVIAVST